MKKIQIYGAGGLGKEVFFLKQRFSPETIVTHFIDDFKSQTSYCNLPLNNKPSLNIPILIAIANPDVKLKIYNKHKNQIYQNTLIANDFWLQQDFNIGQSSVVFDGVKHSGVNHIGAFVLIHMNTTIGHDTIIEDFCSIMPGVNISGNAHIGKATLVGSGAVILPGIKIGKYCTIGAGAVVTKDIPDNAVAVGVPARVVEGRK